MPKAIDLAYVTYQATDLGLMEEFMHDFGLVTAERRNDLLFLRGADSAPFVHVTRLGSNSKFLGGGLRMASRADLDELASMPGSSPVEKVEDWPGGGWRVRMIAPDGFIVDAVWGQKEVETLSHRPRNPVNWGDNKERVNASLRPKREAGLVLRLGHFVLRVTNHAETLSWFQTRFGLLTSDVMCVPGDESKIIGTFVRFDRGSQPVDHHCLLINEASEIGVHHCSFEMQDIDAVMGAHDYLVSKGHKLDVGVGRHLIGSQIFDYWRDPFGFRVEHYTDGDVANNNYKGLNYQVSAEDTTQWGSDPTPDFFH
ncbi:VOC family protein [Bradyrhizobium sp. Cp5.3]|uniref:VOC family protein n=1 Tax=Bradyrhizobium sp. Cp5.3 TaxID=443598 RepID=UPI000402D5C6|nr:VOC family protein [Bradyrhizobium sp. Cp5.3]